MKNRNVYTEEVTRTEVKQLFATFRKAGYHARMNFACCTTCASYEAGQTHLKPKHKGHVSYNNQDTERAFPRNMRFHGSESNAQSQVMETRLYLLWMVNDDNATEAQQMEMGRELCKMMNDAGFSYEWDGNPDTKIALLPVKV